MEEVVRFRIARAPQRAVVAPDAQLALSEGSTLRDWFAEHSGHTLKDLAQYYVREHGLLPPTRSFGHEAPNVAAMLTSVRWLDELLVAHGNRVAWADIRDVVREHLDGDPTAVVVRPAWTELREALSLALVAAAVTDVTPALRADVLRLLLVMGLLELAAIRRSDDGQGGDIG